jgi:hypothetical protein
MMALLSSPPVVSHAVAQTEQQIWGELTLQWIKSHTWTFSVDLEPKVLVARQPDEPGWATLDVTPKVDYARGKWFECRRESPVPRERSEIEGPQLAAHRHALGDLQERVRDGPWPEPTGQHSAGCRCSVDGSFAGR